MFVSLIESARDGPNEFNFDKFSNTLKELHRKGRLEYMFGKDKALLEEIMFLNEAFEALDPILKHKLVTHPNVWEKLLKVVAGGEGFVLRRLYFMLAPNNPAAGPGILTALFASPKKVRAYFSTPAGRKSILMNLENENKSWFWKGLEGMDKIAPGARRVARGGRRTD